MNRKKLTSETQNKQPNADRRSFIKKTGAVAAAALATAVAGVSKTTADQLDSSKEQMDRLSNQVGILEDANAIRKMHQAYEYHLDKGDYEEVVALFAQDGEVYFNGGIFQGKDKGVRRLYLDHFSQGLTGKKIDPAPEFKLDLEQQQESIKVAPDRNSAKARFHFSMQVGTPIISDSQLVQMARLQGQGILQWWEGGICEISYVKERDIWRIQRLDYRVTGQAKYTPGWAYSKPIVVPIFSNTYPENPTGPDKLA
jgi:hypothetical protein